MNQKIIFYWLFFSLFSFSLCGSSSSSESPPTVHATLVVDDRSDNGILTTEATLVSDCEDSVALLALGSSSLTSCESCGIHMFSFDDASQEETHMCATRKSYCRACFFAHTLNKIKKGKAFVSCPSCEGHYYSEDSIRNLMRGRGKILENFEKNLERAPHCGFCAKVLPERMWHHWLGGHNCREKGRRNYCCKSCMIEHVLLEIKQGRPSVHCPFCQYEKRSFKQEEVDPTFCYSEKSVVSFLEEVGTKDCLQAKEKFQARNESLRLRGKGKERRPCPQPDCEGVLENPKTGTPCAQCKVPFVEPETPEGCRRCPNCRTLIFKTGGCDKMFCTECGFEGSWKTHLENPKK